MVRGILGAEQLTPFSVRHIFDLVVFLCFLVFVSKMRMRKGILWQGGFVYTVGGRGRRTLGPGEFPFHDRRGDCHACEVSFVVLYPIVGAISPPNATKSMMGKDSRPCAGKRMRMPSKKKK